MITLVVTLLWQRSKKVTHLLPEPGPPVARHSIVGGLGKPERIVCEMEGKVYRPLERYKRLFSNFSKIRSTNELLNFSMQYGALTADGFNPDRGDNVNRLLWQAGQMRLVLYQPESVKGKRTVENLATLNASLEVDYSSGTPLLNVSPPNLLSGLWLQLAQAVTRETAFRLCRHCDEPFEAGPRTGRRLDAKFCSDAHRIAFNNANRTATRVA